MDKSFFDAVLNPNPGWYRGDLHAHTSFSDGVLSTQELLDLAKLEGLDFLGITDHNTVGAFRDLPDQAQILVIPGAEVTLDSGHFNAFGIRSRHDWMTGLFDHPGAYRQADLSGSPEDLIDHISRSGHLISINHPLLVPWAWLIPGTAVSAFDCLEVWNDPSWPDNRTANPAALDMWTRWLNVGHRVTAIGGSDFHRPLPPPGLDKPAERLGYPGTYIYAENLSLAALSDGLRNQRAYVSLGPRLDLHIRSDGQDFRIGDDMGLQTGSLEIQGAVSHHPGTVAARIIRNGKCVLEKIGPGEGLQIEYATQADPNEAVWFRLDVLDENRAVLGFSNPIFCGPRRQPEQIHFGDFLET
jgi:hypothetical protein